MDKDYIEVKIPILDSVDEMKVVKTFTQEQLWYVCAIAKAFEKSEQQVKKQKEVIDRTINAIDLVIELIKQQPTEDDKWILDRLNGFKIILEDKEVSE